MDEENDRMTITWGAGGPKTAEQRKTAKMLFLAALKQDPNVSLACDVAHISRNTVYEWRNKNPTFQKDWDDALEWIKDTARSSIYKRGILGWDEKVVSQGQLVYEYEPVVDEEGNQQHDKRGKPLVKGGKPLLVRKYSDTLAMGYAKANLPEYKDKPQLNVHAQLADLAEQRKQKVLAELEAAIKLEDEESSHQEEKL
jgi:hypothetical protein